MIRIELVSVAKVDLYRSTRLAALKDTPLAFGSTFEGESKLTDAQWLERVARNTGDRSCVYLAFHGEEPCGIAGAYFENEPIAATLFSMWVSPMRRRQGVGEQLVEACKAWCQLRSTHSLNLLVTDCNAGAIAFYERLGFSMTGRTEPYPNDPALLEYEMAMRL